MITEDYISFETAKLLKEKGFDVYVRSYYEKNEYKTKEEFSKNNALWNWNISSFRYSAPTLQMAMKWLREVHNLLILISVDNMVSGYEWSIYYTDSHEITPYAESGYKSYEDACEAAIRYCLENLI